MRIDYRSQLVLFYNTSYEDGVPKYVKSAGKSWITIQVSDFRGSQNLKITVKDIVEYYRSEAGNLLSGCRSLAGYAGDWRNIDALAKECLEWFKFVNREGLNREGKKYGMELRG